jgi:hypothetical protein
MLPASTMFWLLSLYNSVSKTTERTISIARKIYRSLYGAFVPDAYLFFENVAYPYPEAAVNPHASTSANPVWRYLSETHQFVSWNLGSSLEAAQMTHALPILSLDIYEDDTTVYDLSDFIEKIRVYNSSMEPLSPCVAHIVNAWILSSGIVLNPTRSFKVRYMTQEAETVECELDSMDILNSCSSENETATSELTTPASDIAHESSSEPNAKED